MIAPGLVRQVLGYSAARFVPTGIAFFFTLLCVQGLSDAQYGAYTLLLLPATIAGSLAGGIAGQPMLRYGALLRSGDLAKAVYLAPALAALALTPALLVYYAIGPDHRWLAIVPGLCLPLLMAVVDTRRSFYVAHGQSGSVFKLDAMRSVVMLLVLVGLFQAPLERAIWMPVLAMCMGYLLAAMLYRPALHIEAHSTPPRTMSYGRAYFVYGGWLATWLLVLGVVPLLERLIIERAQGIDQVGVYASLADPMGAMFSAATGILVSLLMPRYVAAWAQPGARGEIARLSGYAIAATLVVALLILLAGALTAQMAWGRLSSTIANHAPLALLMWVATLALQVGIFLHKPLELQGRGQLMVAALVVAMGAYIVAAWAAIGSMGLTGMMGLKLLAALLYIGAVVWAAGRGSDGADG